MLCPKCGKESNNLRICAFCQTPYPVDRASQATPRFSRAVTGADAAAGDPRAAMAAKALRGRALRWAGIGALTVFTIGFYFVTRDRVIPVGVALPDIITIPMTPNDAARMIKSYEATTDFDQRTGSVMVHVPSRNYPQRRDGQLALAQQYAHADAIVMGRKREIVFFDPSGAQFARADPTVGVVLTR